MAGGDVLLLYTDGLIEHRRQGLDHGVEAVIAAMDAAVAASPGKPLPDLVDRRPGRIATAPPTTVNGVGETPVGGPVEGHGTVESYDAVESFGAVESYGAWVRRRRDDLGLTQEDLADQAGLSVRTIRYVESGRTRARPHTRRLIDAVLRRRPEPADTPAPALLPPDVHEFTARGHEIAELDRALLDPPGAGRSSRIVVLTGTAGVGKTALAVHWAHRVRDRFSGGQIYLDLRGFSPSGAVSTADAARRMLYAAGVAPNLVPPEPDAQIDRFRSEMSRRRVLLILDNVRDAEQVRALLPGGAGAAVLVVSRAALAGLVTSHGAEHVEVGLLPALDARLLLQRRLGPERVSAEPEAVDRIVRGCARLPLALAIVAGRATVRPRIPLARLADELSRTRRRLDALSADDPAVDVRTVLSWSYRALRPASARLFRLLSLHPGPEVGVSAAGSLAGVEPAVAARLLGELAGAHLLGEERPERYSMHDVLRAYAAELAATDDSPLDRRAATVRLLDYYLCSAHAADQRLNPALEPVEPLRRHPGVVPERPLDAARALAWLTTERPVLTAVVHHAAEHGDDAYAWRLGLIMINVLDAQGYWYDEAAMARVAVAATVRVGDPAAQARARRLLGFALYRLERNADAERELTRALRLYRRTSDAAGQAHAHYNISQLRAVDERYTSAIFHARRAYARYSQLNHARGQANALNAWGWFLARSGRPHQAVAYCREALSLHRQVGSLRGLVNTHDSLGHIHRQLHDHPQAIAHYQQAAALSRRLGDRYYEASVLQYAGRAHLDAGSPQEAGRAWRHALAILDDIEPARGDRERIRELLAGLPVPAGAAAPADGDPGRRLTPADPVR